VAAAPHLPRCTNTRHLLPREPPPPMQTAVSHGGEGVRAYRPRARWSMRSGPPSLWSQTPGTGKTIFQDTLSSPEPWESTQFYVVLPANRAGCWLNELCQLNGCISLHETFQNVRPRPHRRDCAARKPWPTGTKHPRSPGLCGPRHAPPAGPRRVATRPPPLHSDPSQPAGPALALRAPQYLARRSAAPRSPRRGPHR
jgi:hypothetical protein